ncbi:chromate transporter [Haloechinothrix halophila]|uniref:chromate transporter n=1 Tax=Haloechinothrix halophila TaxID=1069073 RepID=UPI000419DDD5|nr:chromate transporter [Haloechinothrix halophila]
MTQHPDQSTPSTGAEGETQPDTPESASGHPEGDVVPFGQAIRTWFAISLQTFGGPAGQIAVMQHTLVDDKRWIGQRRFLHALNYCMLLPGPEAQQLAIYIGWLLNGVRGGLAAGAFLALALFGVPFTIVIAVAALAGWLLAKVKPHALRAGNGSEDSSLTGSAATTTPFAHTARSHAAPQRPPTPPDPRPGPPARA